MKKFNYLVVILCFLASCGKDDGKKVSGLGPGLVVTNEGAFGNGTGTISFIGDTGQVKQLVFQNANNGAVLGNTVQSIQLYRERYYIVVNNANKVVITDKNFKYLGEIKGLFQPRFITFYKDYAFVSQWGENNLKGGVAVVNLLSLKVEKVIETGNGPEEMLLTNDSLWVTNGGSYNPDDFSSYPDSTIVLINAKSQSISNKILVGDNPNSIVKNGNIYYVACSGKSFKNGSVYMGDGATFNKMTINGLDPANSNFTKMILNTNTNNQLLLINGVNAISFSISGNTLDQYKVAATNSYRVFYKKSNNHFYFCNPADFASSGSVVETDDNFSILNTYPAGIIPGYIIESNQ